MSLIDLKENLNSLNTYLAQALRLTHEADSNEFINNQMKTQLAHLQNLLTLCQDIGSDLDLSVAYEEKVIETYLFEKGKYDMLRISTLPVFPEVIKYIDNNLYRIENNGHALHIINAIIIEYFGKRFNEDYVTQNFLNIARSLELDLTLVIPKTKDTFISLINTVFILFSVNKSISNETSSNQDSAYVNQPRKFSLLRPVITGKDE